jgi:hypothetical protein
MLTRQRASPTWQPCGCMFSTHMNTFCHILIPTAFLQVDADEAARQSPSAPNPCGCMLLSRTRFSPTAVLQVDADKAARQSPSAPDPCGCMLLSRTRFSPTAVLLLCCSLMLTRQRASLLRHPILAAACSSLSRTRFSPTAVLLLCCSLMLTRHLASPLRHPILAAACYCLAPVFHLLLCRRLMLTRQRANPTWQPCGASAGEASTRRQQTMSSQQQQQLQGLALGGKTPQCRRRRWCGTLLRLSGCCGCCSSSWAGTAWHGEAGMYKFCCACCVRECIRSAELRCMHKLHI